MSVGPGSFTGLRVGVVCAKTLAYATGARLAAVDTLEAIAANSPPDVETVHVITDAQRGDLFVGTYRRTADGRLAPRRPARNCCRGGVVCGTSGRRRGDRAGVGKVA